MKNFVNIFLGIWLVVLLMGEFFVAESKYSNLLESLLINGCYIFTLVLSTIYTFQFCLLIKNNKNNKKSTLVKSQRSQTTITYLVFLVLIGGVMLIINKIFIQGINYSEGLAVARYEMVELSEQSSSFSSPLGILGYMFCSIAFILTPITMILFEENKSLHKFIAIIAIFFSVGVISVLTGGRTSIILLVTLVLSSCSIRRLIGKSALPFTGKQQLLTFVLCGIIVIYILYIFQDRASANDVEAEFYAENIINFMGGRTTKQFDRIGDLPSKVEFQLYFISIMVGYAAHSNWILQGVISKRERFGQAVFVNWRTLLAKTGFIDKPKPWLFAGRFITFPGGLFYDFGILGVFIFSLFQGCILGSSFFSIRYKNINILNVSVFSSFASIAFASPMIIVTDILIYPVYFVTIFIFYLLLKPLNRTIIFKYI